MMRILSLPVSFFRKYSSGELSSRASSVSSLCGMLLNNILSVGLSSLMSLLYVTQIFSFAPALVWPSILIILATVTVSIASSLVQIKITRRKMELDAKESGMSLATLNGIQNDMPVVTPQGLVGRVVEAGPNSSKVQLILDPRSSVGTIVQRAESRVTGIVQGDMDNPTMPQMVNIPKNADVVEGDVIVTSGFGGIYPKGIIVGLVSSLKNDDGGLLKIGVLESAVDFQKLEDVMVITASREAPPEPIKPPVQTPGTETDPVTGERIADQKAEGQK